MNEQPSDSWIVNDPSTGEELIYTTEAAAVAVAQNRGVTVIERRSIRSSFIQVPPKPKPKPPEVSGYAVFVQLNNGELVPASWTAVYSSARRAQESADRRHADDREAYVVVEITGKQVFV